ncbi:hypothetical protein EVAR_103054_1 [Eumeta japonica]|uniref:Uncharacterized protein n=1 Tax=Eumeta variegata TaxID=151549 RepID=A0A4C1WE31_EUMVA|nr:hypothetical protein EVAR_103054_1 [Eumeta japonica]
MLRTLGHRLRESSACGRWLTLSSTVSCSKHAGLIIRSASIPRRSSRGRFLSTQGHTEIKRGKYLIESYLDQELEKPVYFGKLPHPVYLLKLGSRVSKKWTSRHWTVLP